MKRTLGNAADIAHFIWRFILSPQKTGAIAPSSRWLARLMAEKMELEKAGIVVDVGAGTGVFTGEALKRVRRGAKVIAIEINPQFASVIRKRYPRARVISDSVEHISRHLKIAGHRQADAILCSLPWSHFPENLQRRLLDSMVKSLKPGGHFSSFAYIHSCWWPSARKFHAMLRSRFGRVTTSRVTFLNLPPAYVYRCVK